MKTSTSRFSAGQIPAILKQAEAATPYRICAASTELAAHAFYKWRAKFGGMDAIPYGPPQGSEGRESPAQD